MTPARLIVDGMNVIGSRPDRWWNDPDRAMRRFIEELDRYASQKGEEVTVVFDRRPPDVVPGRHGAVMVAFASRRGRNAAATRSSRWWRGILLPDLSRS